VGAIDFILNLAGLLLWLNAVGVRLDSWDRGTPATLAGTLRRGAVPRRAGWLCAGALAALLLLRALLYWHVGAAVNWTPRLPLGVIALSFPLSLGGEYLGYMLLYSLLSFGVLLAGGYLTLLFLSFLGNRNADNDPVLRLTRALLGPVGRWPWPLRLALPGLGAGLAWLALNPLLAHWGLLPTPASWVHRLEQAVLIGAGAYLGWKYVIAALLVLHLVNSYVYLGGHPFWTFVSTAAQRLLRPLRPLPLQVSKVDFAPLLWVAVVLFLAERIGHLLTRLYGRLPL